MEVHVIVSETITALTILAGLSLLCAVMVHCSLDRDERRSGDGRKLTEDRSCSGSGRS